MEDVLEQIVQSQMRQYARRVAGVAIGEHQPPPRQARYGLPQGRVRLQGLDRDVVHLGQERLGGDAMVGHQPRQRGAVLVQVLLLQRAGLEARQAGLARHELGHPAFHQGDELGPRRIEGVVEVEDPDVDVAEVSRHLGRPGFPTRAR